MPLSGWVECFTNGLRLYFVPEEPFSGHVYVDGFYFDEDCHVNQSNEAIAVPFYVNIFYNGHCNVRCQVQSEPAGVSYSVVITVQHHYLFVTEMDRTYSATCFYPTNFDTLTNEVDVNYMILMNSTDGEPARVVEVGDRLVHKWSCELEGYGMLIHSCVVNAPRGTTFQVVDRRGCVTDPTLTGPLIYNDNLTEAHSFISAFKFANELTITFQCKVTFCIKEGNECEGISPPNCTYQIPPSSTPPIDSGTSEEQEQSTTTSITTLLSSSTIAPTTEELLCDSLKRSGIRKCKNFVAVVNESTTYAMSEQMNYREKRFLNESEQTMNIPFQEFPTKTNFTNINRLTLDVNAEQNA
ncbi:unnamed protein product [Acanthocheilonema viteae]|uniref:ZP domain-containing protein n=1 Tax=Acanthocheilonema viteae TaxID=6277 RepID=A0A498SIX2_ACAVI|nr:unnamed protein product [Acanthocheilonema viteae]